MIDGKPGTNYCLITQLNDIPSQGGGCVCFIRACVNTILPSHISPFRRKHQKYYIIVGFIIQIKHQK